MGHSYLKYSILDVAFYLQLSSTCARHRFIRCEKVLSNLALWHACSEELIDCSDQIAGRLRFSASPGAKEFEDAIIDSWQYGETVI